MTEHVTALQVFAALTVISAAVLIAGVLANIGEKCEKAWRRRRRTHLRKAMAVMCPPDPKCRRFPDHQSQRLRTPRDYVS
jgi:hypothetical protein